jgi:hypothetical protein
VSAKADTNSAGVAVCRHCTEELVVVCPNGHDPEPFGVEPDVTKRALRSDNRKLRRRTSTLEAENKTYRGHNLRLTERVEELTATLAAVEQARRAKRVPSEVARLVGRTGAPRTYKPKRCNVERGGCAEIFNPTGPRDELCRKCKGFA